jgi:hypothetical protein
MQVMQRLQSATGGPLALWNDDPSRTVDEVLAVLDRAIERV